jgi:uncharacterized protein (UPF0335 family)
VPLTPKAAEERIRRLERENARFRQEREILKKSDGHLQQPKAVRFQFVEAHREGFEVQVMCEVLDVSRSGYYTWRTRPASQREMADAVYMEQIKS